MEQPENNQQPESVIKSIMVEQEEKSRSALDPVLVVVNAVNTLGERERAVLSERYGLATGTKATLEEVGKRLNVTRERVRQIEANAIQHLLTKPTKELAQLVKLVNSHIVGLGGLVSLDELTHYLKAEDDRAALKLNAIRFVMDVNNAVVALPRRADLRSGWVKRDFPVAVIAPILTGLEEILVKADKTLTARELWDELVTTQVYQAHESQLNQTMLEGLLGVAARLARANDNKWGLAAWPTVVPKRIRDKIFLVLKGNGKPMHFTDITEAINRHYPASKVVLSRTVHNELISDKRFVLVGRGTYALKSWGFKPGVVSDVIIDVLKQSGRPMSTEAIIDAVLEKRQVKRNTVIANLQNKTMFQKVERGMYTLADKGNKV